MILAAGLTPAWQQILEFDGFQLGEVNRAENVWACASGKVINVGIALANLGATSKTLAPLGGPMGEAIREEFAVGMISTHWIETEVPTRTCTTILDRNNQDTTELVENAQSLSDACLQSFRDAFREEAKFADCVVLSGSLSPEAPRSFYRELMKDCRGRVILDARGPELSLALEQNPWLIKPNHEELAKTVGHDFSSVADVWRAMRELNQRGAEWVVVSQGADDVLVSTEDHQFEITPASVPVANPIACGDCLAAGIAWGITETNDTLESLRLGVAAAADNLSNVLPARLDADRVRSLAETISVRETSS